MMPNKAWSDPRSAGSFLRSYQGRVAEATVTKARGGAQKPIRLEPIPFV